MDITPVSVLPLNDLFFSKTELMSCSRRKIRFPEHCTKLERWHGPNINKVKQYETVLS